MWHDDAILTSDLPGRHGRHHGLSETANRGETIDHALRQSLWGRLAVSCSIFRCSISVNGSIAPLNVRYSEA